VNAVVRQMPGNMGTKKPTKNGGQRSKSEEKKTSRLCHEGLQRVTHWVGMKWGLGGKKGRFAEEFSGKRGKGKKDLYQFKSKVQEISVCKHLTDAVHVSRAKRKREKGKCNKLTEGRKSGNYLKGNRGSVNTKAPVTENQNRLIKLYGS